MSLEVIQFCPDDRVSSGVNCFCTELNAALREFGIDCRIVRNVSAVEEVSGVLTVSGVEGGAKVLAIEGADSSEQSNISLILHIHGLWSRAVHRAATWARANGVPVVWSTHGMTAPWAMAHKRWKKLPAWWLYQRRDLRHAAAIHCTTDLEVGWNHDLGLVKTFVAPLGTHLKPLQPLKPLKPLQPLKPMKPFTVLFVGRIYPVKGLVNLVRAGARLAEGNFQLNDCQLSKGMCEVEKLLEEVDGDVVFRLVGPDEAGHRAELEAECRRLGAEESGGRFLFRSGKRVASPLAVSVEFAGEKRGEELAAEHEGCDVLVLPSFTENFGGVVVDALAHGKPVIASRFTPWQELVARRCGWWVDNAPESLAQTIVEAAGLGPDALAAMGARGRALVDEKYTWSAVAKTMKDVYASLRSQELTSLKLEPSPDK